MRSVKIGKFDVFADETGSPGLEILQNGYNYEVHIRKELERLIPKAKGFIDVGANIGVHTINAKDIRGDIPVMCFEPSPANFEILVKNITHNDLSYVAAVPVALSSEEGFINGNNDPHNMQCSKTGEEGDYPLAVRALTLDRFDTTGYDLMKIDVEGFEFAVWSGASKFFSTRPTIIFELCPGLTHRSGVTAVEQLQWLIDRKYFLTVLDYKPGIRKTFTDAQACHDYAVETCGKITDILAEPVP